VHCRSSTPPRGDIGIKGEINQEERVTIILVRRRRGKEGNNSNSKNMLLSAKWEINYLSGERLRQAV